jgi:hypothetical protein
LKNVIEFLTKMLTKFIIFNFIIAIVNCEYDRLVWSDCGSKEVQIRTITITPMPIIQPGNATLIFDGFFKRSLSGPLATKLNIIRTVAGLALPIRCYLALGVYVGSCDYTDLCAIVATLLPDTFNPLSCPPELLDYGIDCKCPFKLRDGDIYIDQVLTLPDAAATVASFLASGDFDIKINSSDDLGAYGCVNIKFSVKSANKPSGK